MTSEQTNETIGTIYRGRLKQLTVVDQREVTSVLLIVHQYNDNKKKQKTKQYSITDNVSASRKIDNKTITYNLALVKQFNKLSRV